ncbi:hypothetical protein [Streptomyces sp. AD55]|uniref:hypothetical protein n=1 Tax=Streptomyces sp. AD55 TaxID=3242895 RepID=UPI003529CBB5
MNGRLLQDLREALGELTRYADRLTVRDATPELLREVDQGLALARRLAAAAARLPVTGCREHPDGPVAPEAGGCLLCNTRRRHPHRTPPAAPVAEVLRAIEEHGAGPAEDRYGARAVTRALVTAGKGTTTNLPTAYRTNHH